MSHTLRVLAVIALVGRLRGGRRIWVVPIAVGLWAPVLGAVSAGVAGLVKWTGRIRRRWRNQRLVDAEIVLLGELVALGLAAGMTFVEALRRGAEELHSSLRREVDAVVRAVQKDGSHVVLEAAAGRGRRLYLLAGRAMVTGAPVLDAVEMFVDEMRAAERARRQAALRRLPVTLVFPLALLILPGFVIVVLAPALVGSLQRIGS